jgi:hypothetical protein
MDAIVGDPELDIVTDHVARLTGHAPVSLREFLAGP